MDDGKDYVFKSSDIDRLKRTNARQERYYKNRPIKEPKGARVAWQGLRPAKATAGFTAGSVSSPSSASVTLYMPSGTGFTATGGATLTAYNPYTGTVASGALVWLAWFNGHAYVVAANCS